MLFKRRVSECTAATIFVLLALLHRSRSIAADQKEYFPPPDSTGGWRTLKDAASIRRLAGMEQDRLQQAFEFTSRCTQNGGLLVVRHGYLVYEGYFGRAHRNGNPDMASTGKAVTSIACGIMLREFKNKVPAGLDQKVLTQSIFPKRFHSMIPERQR